MLTAVLVLLAAVAGSTGIVAVIGWLWYRTKRLEDAGFGSEGGRQALLDRLELLREELDGAQAETAKLGERLDFVERLLDSGSASGEGEARRLPSAETDAR